MSCPHCAAGLKIHVTYAGYGHWVPDDNGTYQPCTAEQEPSASLVFVRAARNRLEHALLEVDEFVGLRAHVREALLDLRRALGELPLDTGEEPE